MKTQNAKVNSEETVTATKTQKATPKKRIATTNRKAKEDIAPEAKKKLDTKNLKDTVKTAVISQREVKWKYPENISDPLERKKWRGQQRTIITKLEAAVTTAKDDKSKKVAETQLAKTRKEVLLVP